MATDGGAQKQEQEPRKPRVAIIIYSMYNHVAELAEAEKAGIEAAGGTATMFRVEETLGSDVLKKMHVPDSGARDHQIFTREDFTKYDAYLFGIPTRFGNMPTQFKALWDYTGSLWVQGRLAGKYAGVFVSTGSPGGGQEETAYTLMTTLVHHGIVFVPFGYSHAFDELSNVNEVHGGSPWGAGTLSGSDNKRCPSKLELEIAKKQGHAFYKQIDLVDWKEKDKQDKEKLESAGRGRV